MEKTHGSSIGPDALWAHSRRAYRSLKTFFFRDRRHEVPRHLSGGLHIQQLYVSPQEEAACFFLSHGRALVVIIAARLIKFILAFFFSSRYPSCFVLGFSPEPHEFSAVSGSAGRGPVRDNAPHHGERHDLHQDLCRRAALSHQRRLTSEIFRDFRGHRRGGGDHRQADGQIQRIRLCDHGGQGGSRAGVQGRKPHHRRQEGQRELGVPGSEASQHAVKSLCWSSAGPSHVGSEAIRTRPAVRLPPGLPPAQPGAAVPAQPHSGGAHLPLPGLQLRLQPLRPHRTGAVPLHSFTVALCWLPQLQLLPRNPGAHSHCIPDPPGRHPSSSGCTHHHVCRPAGLPPLPSAPARPHAVSSSELPN